MDSAPKLTGKGKIWHSSVLSAQRYGEDGPSYSVTFCILMQDLMIYQPTWLEPSAAFLSPDHCAVCFISSLVTAPPVLGSAACTRASRLEPSVSLLQSQQLRQIQL